MKNISIVIPIYNEEKNILKLFNELKESIEYNKKYQFEIIFVNDCSKDNSLAELNRIKNDNDIIKIINNNLNLGQSRSINIGIQNSKFSNIITMDGDGQNNPKDLKIIIDNYFSKKVDLVSGIRKKRKDKFIKKFSSKIANNIRSFFLKDNCTDTGCSLKMFRKEIFLSFPFFDGIHRFIPSLFTGYNKKIIYLNVDHRPRKYGKSNYGTFNRLIKGIVDLIRVFFIIKMYKRQL